MSEHPAPQPRCQLPAGRRRGGRPPGTPVTVVVANRKGGVGKTLTTIYTARWLARWGRRVVVHDLDPQRGVWDFAEALGRPDGRVLRRLAVVDRVRPRRSRRTTSWWTPRRRWTSRCRRCAARTGSSSRSSPTTSPSSTWPSSWRRWRRRATSSRPRAARRAPGQRAALAGAPDDAPPRPAVAADADLPVLDPVPNSRAVLRYSLAGGLWRQVAEALLERGAARPSRVPPVGRRQAARELARV